jgi:hypothetical protein
VAEGLLTCGGLKLLRIGDKKASDSVCYCSSAEYHATTKRLLEQTAASVQNNAPIFLRLWLFITQEMIKQIPNDEAYIIFESVHY